ncbi:unnamed protein product [Closterium sp. NIES-53]
MTTLRVLLHVAAQRDYELHSLDFNTAFLQGSLHEEIWLRRPPGFTGSFPPGTQWSLRRPVYGLRQAPREWHDTLRTTLAALGFAPSTANPSLFLRTDTSLPLFYILVYVDDLVLATADTAGLAQVNPHMVQQVLQRFDFTYSSPQATPLSTRHSLSALPSDESVEPSGPYPELVGCLMYLMTCTRPYLAYPLSILARYVAPGRHRPEHMAAAKRATQRSSQGYTFSLGSGSVSWRSTRSSSVLGSSCEAEIYAGAMAAQELRWLTYLLTGLGEPPRSPPVLYVDNKAMLALCREHILEHRTKHIALRYFLAHELQQRGQLRLAYVASEANTADIFTKALQPGDHQRFCTMLACFALLDWSCDLFFSPTLPMGGDCYLCVPPDPGIEAAALGAGEAAALGASASAPPGAGESALSGTASAQVLHTFTLDSGASRSFFRDRTTLTPLSRPVAVSLADPSGGPVLASFSTVLPCPAAPSGTLRLAATTATACATAAAGGGTVGSTGGAAGAGGAGPNTDRHCLSWPLSWQLQRLGVDSSGHCLSRTTPPLSSFRCIPGRVEAAALDSSESAVAPGAGESAAALGARDSADALGASASSATCPASIEALHTFTLDSGASRCFFRDCTTVTPLAAPIPVSLADPTGGTSSCASLHSPPVSGSPLWRLARVGYSLTRISSGTTTLVTPRCRVSATCTPVSLSLAFPSPSPASSCLPCVEGRQRATPHSSKFPPTTAPLQTLHLDVWGPAPVDGTDQERYFLLVVDDYTRYTTVFPLRCKVDVSGFFIPWICATRRQLGERFRRDFPVLRLHSDRGGEFSSDLLAEFCRDNGIRQSFTLPASPQQNGIAERRIGLIMEVAHISMIHAATPDFLWPFAVRYAAHQLNLWPRVSELETLPTVRWTGRMAMRRCFGSGERSPLFAMPKQASSPLALSVASSLASPPTPHCGSSTTRASVESSPPRVSPFTNPLPPQGPAPSAVSQVDPPPLVEPLEISYDSSGPAKGGDPATVNTAATHRSPSLETPPGFPPRPTSPPPQPAAVDSGAETAGAEPWGAETEGEGSGGAATGGAGYGGAASGGAGSWGNVTGGADSRDPASPRGGGVVDDSGGDPGAGQPPQPDLLETLSPQAIRAWIVRRGRPGGGGYGPAGAGAASPGGTAGAGGTGGTAGGAGGAAGAGGTRGARGTRAAGTRGAGATSAGAAGAAGHGGARTRGTKAARAGGATSAGGATGAVGIGGAGAAGTGGARADGTGGARTRGARAAEADGAAGGGGNRGAGAAGPGGAPTRGAGAAGAGGVAGAGGAGGAGGATGAAGTGGAGGTIGARGAGAAGARGATGAGVVPAAAGGTAGAGGAAGAGGTRVTAGAGGTGAARNGGDAGATGVGGAGGAAGAGGAGAGGTGDNGADGTGGARTRGAGAAGAGGTAGARGAGAGGTGGTRGAGAAGPGGARTRGARAAGASGAVGAEVLEVLLELLALEVLEVLLVLEELELLVLPRVACFSTCGRIHQSQPQLLLGSPLPAPAPAPHTEVTESLTKRRDPETHASTPVRARRVARPRPPAVQGTHGMTLRPSSVPHRVVLPEPSASSLPHVPYPESDLARAASTTLVNFAARSRLDYVASLVTESESVCPPSVEGESALSSDVLKDRQFELECLAATLPCFASMLLCPEGDPDALDIPTPRSYAEYSSQWQTAIDIEMASRKSTGTYVDEVPPLGANIVDGMWIFRVKRPLSSPPAFKARYVARGFRQRPGVDFFQTFSPTLKMTTLQVLLHVAAHRDYELHSLDFSTAFFQGSLHEEIWLRRPPGFTRSFPAGTQWSLRRPVYGLL